MSEDASPDTTSTSTAPGWYPDPRASAGQRYYDGDEWTDAFAPPAPALPEDQATVKDLLWGLALGFGAMGAAGAFAIPLLAFYFPLGGGIASAALILAAVASPGKSRWWAALAVVACLLAVGTGVSAYNDFQDASDAANNALEDLGNF